MGGFNGLSVGMREVYIYGRTYGTQCSDEGGIYMGGFMGLCWDEIYLYIYIWEHLMDSVLG